MTSKNAQIFMGNIIFSKNRSELELIENGYIVVIGSKILGMGQEENLEDDRVRLCLSTSVPVIKLRKTQILIPGFVDTHLHAPQYPRMGLGYDKTVSERMHGSIYPLESRCIDEEYSRNVYHALVNRSIRYGTTTACYTGCIYVNSCNILVDTVVELGQRALIGKANITMNTPSYYTEEPSESLEKTKEFIKYVESKKVDLVKPIISPRSAYNLEMDIMIQLAMVAKYKDLPIQAHLSQNKEEVNFIETLYAMPYANVYDQAQILTNKTIVAHGLHLTEKELMLLARRETSVAHCPGSNLCLKSGVLNIRKLWDYGVKVGLGTDIAGGPNLSMITIMQTCLYISIYCSFQSFQEPLNTNEVFYLATLGGAEALFLDNKIGNFQINKEFDAIVIDEETEDGSLDVSTPCSPKEILDKLIYCGDDRNISAVYIAGKLVKGIAPDGE